MLPKNLPRGYKERPARIEDADRAVALFNACSKKLIGETPHDVDEQRVEWRTPRFNLETDTRVVLAPDGAIVGYGEVWDVEEPHVSIHSWGRVHPDHCSRGIGGALVGWQEARAREAIPNAPADARVALHHGVWQQDERAHRLLEAHGFKLVRHFWRMVIEMDGPPREPAWPEGITVRTFDPAVDLEATVRSVRDAFQDHWGHVDTPFDQELRFWEHWISEEKDFDPSIWYLAVERGQIVGTSLCWPKRHEDPEMGWINVLGVCRGWRRQGIALALLHHSFGAFYRRGKRKVGLGVDAASLTGATRVYERAGMRPVRQSDAYEKELRPGRDLSRRTLLDEGSSDGSD
jgi:mycothiol synthase